MVSVPNNAMYSSRRKLSCRRDDEVIPPAGEFFSKTSEIVIVCACKEVMTFGRLQESGIFVCAPKKGTLSIGCSGLIPIGCGGIFCQGAATLLEAVTMLSKGLSEKV